MQKIIMEYLKQLFINNGNAVLIACSDACKLVIPPGWGKLCDRCPLLRR